MKKLFGSLRREPFRARRHPRSGIGQNYSGRRMFLVLIEEILLNHGRITDRREIDDILKSCSESKPSSLMSG